MSNVVNIDDGLCMGCGACVEICPKSILYLDEKTGTAEVTDQRLCDSLGGCERVCPAGAISVD